MSIPSIHRSFVLAALFCAASTVGAKTIYVDIANPSASDSNAGTSSAPLRTIQAGVNAAIAGDQVIVKSGTYTEITTRFDGNGPGIYIRNKSGTAAAPIVISSEVVGGAIIDQANTGVGFALSQANYITIRGFTIRNCFGGGIRGLASPNSSIIIEQNLIENCNGVAGDNIGGVYMWGFKDCTIRDNTIRRIRVAGALNMNGAAIHGYDQTNCVIENNDLSDAAAGVYHKRSAGTKGLVIRRNKISNVTNGILYSVGGAGDPPHMSQEAYENIIQSTGSGIAATVHEAASKSMGLRITNNVLIGGGVLLAGYGDVTIRNNIFVSQSGYAIATAYGSPVTDIVAESNNLYSAEPRFGISLYIAGSNLLSSLASWRLTSGLGLNDLVSDPQFVSTTDWHLRSSSPGKGMGFDGKDVGAYPTGVEQVGPRLSAPIQPNPPPSVTVQ